MRCFNRPAAPAIAPAAFPTCRRSRIVAPTMRSRPPALRRPANAAAKPADALAATVATALPTVDRAGPASLKGFESRATVSPTPGLRAKGRAAECRRISRRPAVHAENRFEPAASLAPMRAIL